MLVNLIPAILYYLDIDIFTEIWSLTSQVHYLEQSLDDNCFDQTKYRDAWIILGYHAR